MPLFVVLPLTVAGGVVLLVGFDTVGALATRRRPSAYKRLWPIQFALYVVIGFVAMPLVLDVRLVEAIGAAVGFAEATAGWALSWRIGPGRLPDANPLSIALAIASMTAFGLGLALVGALVFNAVAGALVRARL